MICAPLKKKTTNSLLKNLKEAQKMVEVIEIWFDEIKDLNEDNLKKIFKNKQKPFIYKCQNLNNIHKILAHDIQYIDLDIDTSLKTIKEVKKLYPKTKIIISRHDFKKTPETTELKKIVRKIKSKGADIIKIATYANEFEDSIRMLGLLSELTGNGYKAICICMGEKGEITRTAGLVLGNYLMYAPIKKSEASAPGQLTVKQLLWHLKSE